VTGGNADPVGNTAGRIGVAAPSDGTIPCWLRFTSVTRTRRPGGEETEETPVKKDIHPDYVLTTVTCTCGNTFETHSTSPSGEIRADVCSNCHPFYTGKQKLLDTGGRVARFEKRYAKTANAAK